MGRKMDKQRVTYLGLLLTYGKPIVELTEVASFFGLSEVVAKKRAALGRLPCRAFRLSGQQSPWLVDLADLAALIEKQREAAPVDQADLTNSSFAK
jgi:hypothetical protein